MKQYIDKAAVVAEIKRRKQTWQHQDQQYVNGGKDVCDYLLGFLDTIEVIKIGVDEGDPKGDKSAKYILDTNTLEVKEVKEEPVTEDLEEEIDNYVKMNGYDGLDSIEEVKYIANHFAKWQKEQMISKMEQFLYEELNNGDIECSDMKFLILYFKKYMEE